jgi:AcrR family transcriptional regulator
VVRVQQNTVAAPSEVRTRTKRSERTRAALLLAARAVFTETGFHDARIADIVEGAQMAHGTFYTYFDSKEDIFLAVLQEVLHGYFTGPADRTALAGSAPIDRIDRASRRFLEFYGANARLMASIDPLAMVDERFASLRRATRLAYLDRVAAAVTRWQAEGLADQDVDAVHLAAALGAMAERMAYLACVFDDGPMDIDEMLAVSNHVWATALGLEQRTPSRARPARSPA